MTETVTDEPIDLIDDLLACSNAPLRFIELAFPHIKPEHWQRKVMTHIGDQLSANAQLSKCSPIQVAVASGNTIGKTALLSWLILWSLTTFEAAWGLLRPGLNLRSAPGCGVNCRNGFISFPTNCAGRSN